MDIDRQIKYEVRDDAEAGPHFSNSIYEHKFCTDCNSNVCSDLTHNQIELHPIIRIPKKTASKKKWKLFYELVKHFGDDNKRQNRH